MRGVKQQSLEALKCNIIATRSLMLELAATPVTEPARRSLLQNRLESAVVLLADALAEVDERCGLVVAPLPERQAKPVSPGAGCFTVGGGRQAKRHVSLIEDDR